MNLLDQLGKFIRNQIMLILLAPLMVVGQSLSFAHQVKLVVRKGETLKINSDSLHIDTLIMHDNSRIIFRAPATILFLENAFIGRDCSWECAGQNGAVGKSPKNALDATHLFGLDGQNGRSLEVTVLFRFLGSLTINTSGGRGGSGVSGNGRSYEINSNGRGVAGSSAGNGGAGGSLSILYACDGFLPVFNGMKRDHAIMLQFNGGKGGIGGRGGKGAVSGPSKSMTGYSGVPGKDGLNGQPGKSGEDGRDGILVLKRLN